MRNGRARDEGDEEEEAEAEAEEEERGEGRGDAGGREQSVGTLCAVAADEAFLACSRAKSDGSLGADDMPPSDSAAGEAGVAAAPLGVTACETAAEDGSAMAAAGIAGVEGASEAQRTKHTAADERDGTAAGH